MHKLICIIVSFNRVDKLSTTINKCLLNGADHIVLVDNNSNSAVAEYLHRIEGKDSVSVIYNKVNQGASYAFKQGISYLPNICDLNSSVVVFLDDDSYLTEDFKRNLSIPVNFIAPKVVDLNGRSLKMNLPLLSAPSDFFSVIKYLFFRPVPKCSKSQTVVSASFVGLTMKAAFAYENRELIPDDFFIYFDDVYFTLKLTRKGYQGRYVPHLKITHDTNDVKRIGSNSTIYYLFRNAVITHKYMTAWWKIIVFSKTIMYLWFILIESEDRFSKFTSLLSGLRDGMKIIKNGK